MSEHGNHHNAETEDRKKSKSSFSSSFWFVFILAGLFIASLNFIKVMSHGEEAHATATHTEATEAHEPAAHHEATPAVSTDTAHHDAAPTTH